MTARARLPSRRIAERFSFDLAGIRYHASFGFSVRRDRRGYVVADTPLEVFLAAGKVGSSIEAIARDTAVFASLALQYGVPLEVLRNAVTRLDDGSAAGPGGRMLDMIAEAET